MGSTAVLKSLIKKHNRNIVFLMETKRNNQKLKQISRVVGLMHIEVMESRGSSGGLALMWFEEVILKCKFKSKRVICCDVKDEKGNGLQHYCLPWHPILDGKAGFLEEFGGAGGTTKSPLDVGGRSKQSY